MNFKNYLLIFVLVYSCSTIEIKEKDKINTLKDSFSNKGFALIYNENLKKNKIINKNLNTRSMIIFQKNLKKDTSVKITNLINNKSLIAKVGKNSNYPSFYNSVISERISQLLNIDINEPYIEIYEINENSTFVAKKAKTFDEEKKVADKAPVDGISIKNLSKNTNSKNNKKNKNTFNYIIKIADFYFQETALLMKKKIQEETSIKNVNIEMISSNTFRVFLGPFKDLNSLKNDFNDISKLNFENLELIKK